MMGGAMGGGKAFCCDFLRMLRDAIHQIFPKVSSEKLILLVKSHSHAKNQEWKRETESMREINKVDQNGQPINQSTTVHDAHLSLLCVNYSWLIDWLVHFVNSPMFSVSRLHSRLLARCYDLTSRVYRIEKYEKIIINKQSKKQIVFVLKRKIMRVFRVFNASRAEFQF